MQTAVVTSRETWLPPFSESLPKVLMVATSMHIRMIIGRKDTSGEGNLFVEFIISLLFAGTKI